MGVLFMLIVWHPLMGFGGLGGHLANWSKGLGKDPACLPVCRCRYVITQSEQET